MFVSWARIGAVPLLLAVAGHAAELRVTATRAEAPPRIDGTLDDVVWQRGEWYGGFKLLSQGQMSAPVQTRFQVAFDADRLYVAARMAEPQTDAIRTRTTERDGKVHSDDCVEIMVDPTGERTEYYHFIINSQGTLYDAQMRQGGGVHSVDWNCEARAAARVGEDEWTAELSVPIVELGLSARSTGLWAINVTRERRAGGAEELSTFAPLDGGFHQARLYAELELPGADLGRYLWQVKTPYESQVLREDGELVYRAKTFVENHTGAFRFFELRAELADDAAAQGVGRQPAGLDHGQKKECQLRVPLPRSGKYDLRLIIADRENPEQVHYIKHVPVQLTYSPIRIALTRPHYRNSIYATQEIAAVELELELSVTEEELRQCRLEAEVAPAEEGSAPVISAAVDELEPKLAMTIPGADKLSVGDYDVRVRLTHDGRTAYAAVTPLRKLPPVEHEWRLDENNVLLHNGEPFLPFGWFSMPTGEMAEGRQQGLTAAQDYGMHWRDPDAKQEFLDAVAASGLYVTAYPYPNNRDWMPAPIWGEPLTDERAEELRQYIREWKSHPALMGWYMADEPELRPALPERTKRIREVVAEEDPYHPCIMLNDTIAGIFKYVEGGDILMPDPYPLFVRGGGAARGIRRVADFMEACREATGGRQAWWVTPQAFNYGDYGRANNRAPTFAELRNMCYQAVAHGAKGFLWYTWSHSRNYPDIGLGMPFLAQEVADLKEAILAPDAEAAVKCEAPNTEEMHWSLRRVGDDWTLFAVNTAEERQAVRFTLPSETGELTVVSEGRAIRPTAGVLADTFEPYAAHIYTTGRALADRETIAARQQQIDAANAARRKPGNLAFEDTGAKVRVSSKSRYGSTPDRVIDGVIDGMTWQDGTPPGAAKNQFPDWIEIELAEEQTLARVAVYTDSLRDYDVQVKAGEDWTTMAQVRDAETEMIESAFQPTKTTAVRLHITATREEKQRSRVWEIEVYGP